MPRATPPALRGLPLLGHLLEYRKDHIGVFRRSYEALGPIFSIRLGPQQAVVIIGPAYNRFFFTQVDKILSLPEVYRFVVPMFGNVLNAAEEEEVRRDQLSLLHSAFKGRKMDRHVDVMVNETTAWLDTLGGQGSFEIFDAFSQLAMNIAASALLGPEVRRCMPTFIPLLDDLARGMDFVLPPNLPLPRFRRRDQARQKLTEMIRPAITERRAHPQRFDDFLQTIVEGNYLEDRMEADETIIGLALMTVFTGYIATAAQSCWSLIQLLQNPSYLAIVEEEREEVLGPKCEQNINVENLGELERLEWALMETQRMHPVMSHYARYNSQEYELGGYRVPKGWLTMVCPTISHRLPEVFTHPNSYDPDRFSPKRAEDRKYDYSLIGFGGGLYRCPGSRFGINEMKCMISLILERYSLELVDPNPRRNFEMGVIRPEPPYLVQYTRRKRGRSALDRSVEAANVA